MLLKFVHMFGPSEAEESEEAAGAPDVQLPPWPNSGTIVRKAKASASHTMAVLVSCFTLTLFPLR